MSGKGGGGLENDLRNWVKKMGIVPDGNASDVIRKLVFAVYTRQIYFTYIHSFIVSQIHCPH
jgi:hypothetical protein